MTRGLGAASLGDVFTDGDPKPDDKPAPEPAPEGVRPEADYAAVFEVLAVAAFYIVITRLVLAAATGLEAFQEIFAGTESLLVAGFLVAVLTQLLLVGTLYAAGQEDVKAAVASLAKKAATPGWSIAATIVAVEVIFIAGGWLEAPGRIFEVSKFALLGSLIPAVDGFTQEVLFRGFFMLRLRRAGIVGWLPIVLSGFAFSLLHAGYGNSLEGGFGAALAPFLGTFGLGMAFAWAFRMSDYRLGPVVAAHVLVILILQPWLALSYTG